MATLDEYKPRRKLVTYGKSAKRNDNLFNYFDEEHAVAKPSVKRSAHHGIQETGVLVQHRRHLSPAKENVAQRASDLVEENLKRGRTSKKASPFTYRSRSVKSQASQVSSPSEVHGGSVFDVPNSDEELDPSDSYASRKRRRLTPLTDRTSTSVLMHAPPTAVQETSPQRSVEKNVKQISKSVSRQMQKTRLTGRINKSQPERNRVTRHSSNRSRKPPARAIKQQPVSPESGSPQPPDRSLRKSTPISNVYVSTPPKSSPETPITPKSTRSAKRLSDCLDSHEVTQSLGRLGLSQLRLDSSRAASVQPEDLELYRRSPSRSRLFRYPRPRTRLVDALSQSQEAPPLADEASDDELSDLQPIESPPESIQEATEVVKPSAQGSSRLKSASVRPHELDGGPRVTYAKQRSYIDDMVTEDDLDVGMTGLSQMSEVSAPAKSSFNSNFSQESHFDISDDDDVNGIGALRSIRELRKAGVNARFESTVDSIFEDIEARPSSSNGRRLTGLMHLHERLSDNDFKRQFLDHQMDKRLVSCAASDANVLSSSIVASTLSLMLTDSQPSIHSIEGCLKRIGGVSPLLLEDSRDLLVIAKDRRQNLSKAIRNDLSCFKDRVLSSRVWPDEKPVRVTPQIVCLRAIEWMVRRARELGNCSCFLNSTSFNLIVDILKGDDAHNIEQHATKDRQLIIGITISILESFTVGVYNLNEEYMNALKRLPYSTNLTSALTAPVETTHYSSLTKQLLLRLVLNVTNNNKELCEAFAQRSLISAMLDIIFAGFEEFAANGASAKDEFRLNIVILSLGTLTNFAEWSGKARSIMMKLQVGMRTYLDSIVAIFRDHVNTFFEASSASQSLSMVAFGYLSVLLSTLCIDPDIREHVRTQLTGRNLNQLLQAVEEFLCHFKKVEQEQQGRMDVDMEDATDGVKAASGFTERFQKIVEGLRNAEMSA